jgi:PPOX class probable F420-dependent enzyme
MRGLSHAAKAIDSRREATMTELESLGRKWAVLLETRKRDGSWVGTAVNIVVVDGRAFFRSYDASGKAKRLRNFPQVRVTPCSMWGRPHGQTTAGRATLLHPGSVEAERAAALLARKHPLLQGRLVPAAHQRKGFRTLYYELTLEPS